MAYSPNLNIRGNISGAILQSLSSYQTGACNPQHNVERYFPLGYTSKKLGIDYANVSELVTPAGGWNPTGFECIDPELPSGDFAQALYGGQLPEFTGPSLNVRVYRGGDTDQFEARNACRVQLTYYCRFRGLQGRTDLV